MKYGIVLKSITVTMCFNS